jgi:hypothetical protein
MSLVIASAGDKASKQAKMSMEFEFVKFSCQFGFAPSLL